MPVRSRPHITPVLRLGVVLGAVSLLAACTTSRGTGPLPGPSRTAPPSSTACPGGVLITAGPVEAAMGLRAMGIELRNCGSAPYRVEGFPAIRVLDQQRHVLDITIGHGSMPISAPDSYDVPPRPVTLQPGEVARARVLWRNTVDDSTRPAITGTHLTVVPAPGGPAQVLTPDGGIVLGTTGRLAVNAWQPTADPSTPASPTTPGSP